MSKYLDPRKLEISILDMLKYDAIKGSDDIIYKDMGDYIQMLVPMNNSKGHDTYEVYYNESGQITKVVGHPHNSGFTGTKKFEP